MSMSVDRRKAGLVLEDGTSLEGYSFGYPKSVHGEVVFNTGMVGYPEALTDPSYKGQILVLTYPLIGNYGVPRGDSATGLHTMFESSSVQVQGLVVSDYSFQYSHWEASKSLADWLEEHQVPALYGIDTRQLTKRLREKGSMLGKIVTPNEDTAFVDPNNLNLVERVSVQEPVVYPGGPLRVVLVDCGCKESILRNLLARGPTVIRVPWDYDFLHEEFDVGI